MWVAMENDLIQVNIGCGQTPTPGWLNYDNSFSVRLAKYPFLIIFAERLRLLSEEQKGFISFAKKSNVLWADATKVIPLPDNSVQALYSSHMIEHLDREEAHLFLKEAYRVLRPNGIIRIVVPDLAKLINSYMVNRDADLFLEKSLLAYPRPKSFVAKLKHLIFGARNHLWMYDGPSLIRLLSTLGFFNPRVLEPGLTTISNPGQLHLTERAEESVYVEATKMN